MLSKKVLIQKCTEEGNWSLNSIKVAVQHVSHYKSRGLTPPPDLEKRRNHNASLFQSLDNRLILTACQTIQGYFMPRC